MAKSFPATWRVATRVGDRPFTQGPPGCPVTPDCCLDHAHEPYRGLPDDPPNPRLIRRLSSSGPGRITGVPTRRHKFRPGLDVMEGRLMLSTLNAFHSLSAARLAPPSFQATATTTQVRLSWNAVGRDAMRYTVKEYTARGWLVLANTKSTSFVVSGLQPGASYWFDVRRPQCVAEDLGPRSAQQVTTLPPAAGCADISCVTSLEQPGRDILERGALRDELPLAENTASGWSVLANTRSTSVVVSGLQPGASYQFDVAAGNASG